MPLLDEWCDASGVGGQVPGLPYCMPRVQQPIIFLPEQRRPSKKQLAKLTKGITGPDSLPHSPVW